MKIIPKVGMGCTLHLYSDRHAYTITRISDSGKTFWMKRDKAKRTDTNGQSESQAYEYTTDDEAPEKRVSFNKNLEKWMHDGKRVTLDSRREYYDPSF